ncbi:MAG: FkbM family methyltransferase [Desulfovibrio sp.]|nr:FkbM family methyltransferase [Desulfovibrio sp.]
MFRTSERIKVQTRPAAILGNGPSLRDFDFKNQLNDYDTFGMNAAYRYWDSINWYPDYYSCLDTVVSISHKDAILRLILNAEQYGIRKFLLTDNCIRELGEAGRRPYVYNFDRLAGKNDSLLRACPERSTGSHTCVWAAALGYADIALLGIDSNYTNIIQEAKQAEGRPHVLEIATTPEYNPNYFFDGYQVKGDTYHVPNVNLEKPTHIVTWNNIKKLIDFYGAVVVNTNKKSNVRTFPFCSFANALKTIQQLREEKENGFSASGLVGPFSREDHIRINEAELIQNFLPEKGGVMLDVGAYSGDTCLPFLQRGWTVHAFEPDPDTRATLAKNTASFSNISIDERAAFCESNKPLPLFTSRESTGITSLYPFRPSHKPTGIINTVSLDDYCKANEIAHVDFLKIDTEGLDLFVLMGFPFERIKPECVLCEFEDGKTLPLGYSMRELADFLINKGYTVYVSEWHPIVRYGIQHEWRKLNDYANSHPLPGAWGNLLAFKTPPAPQLLRLAALKQIEAAKNEQSGAPRAVGAGEGGSGPASETPREKCGGLPAATI